MTFWFTAKNTYNQRYEDGLSWEKYIEWSGLTQLKELVSLDTMLCELAFDADYESEEIYNYVIIDEHYVTDLFNSLDYILKNVQGKSNFNLLTVVKEPEQECNNIQLDNFEFAGYDLLDKDYSVSALTNCGGFAETFSNDELNNVGLLDTYEKAAAIRKGLFENNPNEWHADCFIFALWRHKTIGRAL